jgi:hypothetical protein
MQVSTMETALGNQARGGIVYAARIGYAAEGVVYAVLGVLALMAAFGESNGRLTDSKGAIEAIGDQRTLPASFAQTDAGAWWTDLSRNRGMTFAISGVDELTLDADPGMVLRYARPSR